MYLRKTQGVEQFQIKLRENTDKKTIWYNAVDVLDMVFDAYAKEGTKYPARTYKMLDTPRNRRNFEEIIPALVKKGFFPGDRKDREATVDYCIGHLAMTEGRCVLVGTHSNRSARSLLNKERVGL